MHKLIVGASLIIALTGCQTSGPVDSGTSYAREALTPVVESGELPGIITIFYKDGVQETTCLGYADVAAQRKITLDDHYMQCSQTKGFCGVTIAKLVEEGRLNLDDPVSKYLPSFKTLWIEVSNTNGVRTLRQAKNELTVRMCLNHSGGFPFELPDGRKMGGWSRRMPLRSVAITAANQPILFEPGTKSSYSNVGIDIGAAVVEVITGQRWEDYLKENVLAPLGMNETTFWPTDEQLAGKIELAITKSGEKAKWTPQMEWMQQPYNDDRVFPSAGAGLWTTARDQLKFYKMLMNLGLGDNGVRILKEETVKNLLAVSSRDKKSRDCYSLGLRAPITDAENLWFGHGGAWGTNCMVNWHRRELMLTVIQVSNGGKYREMVERAADKFFKTDVSVADSGAYTGRLQ